MKKLNYIFLSLPFILNSCKTIDYKNTIFTSFYPIYDFTKRIVKDKFEVKNLTPVGSEPHDFEPTAKNIGGLVESPALLVNGLGLDSWTDDLPDEFRKKTHKVTDGIETLTVDNVTDPHVWLSIKNAIKEMKNILDIIVDIDPNNKEYYTSNYNYEVTKFEALDKKYREQLSTISNNYLVVSHAAFGYLCNEYGLTQLYLSGLEPDASPTAKTTEKIVETVKKYNITTIFYEELVGPDIANAIKKETGVKTETLNPLEGLTEEEMKTEDYLSIMEDNLNKIVEALK